MADDGDARVAALRAALRGARTDIWEWDADSDRLANTDLGYELLGYAPGELALTQQAWVEIMHPDDRAGEDVAFQRHVRGESPVYEYTYRIRARSGEWRWFEERGRIVDRHADGRPRRMVGTQADVTAQRAQIEAATQARQRLDLIAQHVPGLLFQFRRDADGHGSFPFVSERCRALLGLDPAAMQHDARIMLRMLERDERQAMLDSIDRSARSLSPWRLQFSLERDGRRLRLRGTATPQAVDGGAVLWHGYIEDVSELLALEQAQREKVAAEAANRAKSEFLSRMSHELRTPLNAVLGFAQLMEADVTDPPSERQRHRLRLVRESGQHLLQMIADLLDLTRIESGGLAYAPGPTPLKAVASEALAMLRQQADAAQVSLSLDVAADVHAWVDPMRLRQVLLNLVGNGIKYNRQGGDVRVAAYADASGPGASVCLTVSDSGIGMAGGDVAQLFQPFFRASRVRQLVEGSGIGLSVTHTLVRMMGGRIDVASEPGVGSIFSVSLPASEREFAGEQHRPGGYAGR